MKLRYTLSFFLLVQLIFPQTARLYVGERLEDKYDTNFIEYIDSDNTGIYFFKRGKKWGKYFYYVEKYDAKNLNRIYQCIIPKIYGGKNKIITRSYYKREYFTILQNGEVDLLFTYHDDNEHKVLHVRIDKDGKCDPKPNVIHSQVYKKHLAIKKAHVQLSNDKRLIFFFNSNETKGITEVSCFKIVRTNSLTLEKSYNFQLEDKNVQKGFYPMYCFNDGSVGTIYDLEGKNRFYMHRADGRTTSREISDLTQLNGYLSVLDENHNNQHFDPKCDTNYVVTFYEKNKQTLGFLDLSYSPVKNDLIRNRVDLLDEGTETQLNGTIGEFQRVLESYNLRRSLETKEHVYKIISRQFLVGYAGFAYQLHLIVLARNKQTKSQEFKVVPINFNYTARDDASFPWGTKLSGFESLNFGSIVANNSIFILMNENKKNADLDPNKSPVNDYKAEKKLYGSNFCCFKVKYGEPVRKIELNYDPRYTVYNIVNNYSQPGNYQYVIVKVNGKACIGKVAIE